MEFSLANLQLKERASFALRALYEAAGCRKYHMGRFEEYGLYQENRSFLSSEQVITFTDLDGRLLALKPDVTLSIAKTAQPAPGETLRYYYHENVYRPSAESHTFKEISQMGLEMLGAVGEAQVQQAVCLAARSLDALGAEWVLEVSHMGYLFGLFDALGEPDTARAKLLKSCGRKTPTSCGPPPEPPVLPMPPPTSCAVCWASAAAMPIPLQKPLPCAATTPCARLWPSWKRWLCRWKRRAASSGWT